MFDCLPWYLCAFIMRSGEKLAEGDRVPCLGSLGIAKGRRAAGPLCIVLKRTCEASLRRRRRMREVPSHALNTGRPVFSRHVQTPLYGTREDVRVRTWAKQLHFA